MTDFGLVGKLIDIVRGGAQTREEKKLQEKFIAVVRRLEATSANTYVPALGSPEFWDAEKMVQRGWLVRGFPNGYMRPGSFTPGLYN